jgi:hypothetical protein
MEERMFINDFKLLANISPKPALDSSEGSIYDMILYMFVSLDGWSEPVTRARDEVVAVVWVPLCIVDHRDVPLWDETRH